MKAKKAREIIERFPNLSKRELSKLLYKENPILFKDVEAARFSIRAVTGAVGNPRWKHTQTTKYIGRLPEGEKNDFSPFVLKGKRIGIICDTHIPYHDLAAIQIALSELKRLEIDTLVLDGDIIDCYQLSRFEKDPNKRSFAHEINLLNDFIDDVKQFFPSVSIVYKSGNHERRFLKFIQQKAPELLGLQILTWDNLIGNRVTTVQGKNVLKAGKLNIIHGDEFGDSIFSPVNAARGLYLRSKTNTIAGHSHVTSEHVERDLNDSITGCWSIGSLCDLHPEWKPINKWNHGFCYVEIDGENFSVHNYKIINGRIV